MKVATYRSGHRPQGGKVHHNLGGRTNLVEAAGKIDDVQERMLKHPRLFLPIIKTATHRLWNPGQNPSMTAMEKIDAFNQLKCRAHQLRSEPTRLIKAQNGYPPVAEEPQRRYALRPD